MRVNLTYFKETGKLYSEGALEVPDVLPVPIGGLKAGEVTPLFEIWHLVRHLQEARRLPGLITGHSAFHVLVEVPDHPHAHPHLLLVDAFPDTWGHFFQYTELRS